MTAATPPAAKPARLRGPQTTLTREVHRAIVRRVRAGTTLTVACTAAGVPKSTWRDWMARGRAGVAPYARWMADVDQARARTESAMARRLTEAADNPRDGWRAALAYLERAEGGRWAETLRLQVEEKLRAASDELLERLRVGLSPEAYDDVLRVLAVDVGDAGEGAPRDHETVQ